MRFVTVAPAKVNLVLRVGALRADGFHDIASLMVPLDLGDPVEVRIGSRAGPVTCKVPGRPELDGAGNLAARAAEKFKAAFGVDRAIAIRIVKRIPVTAGLGGGSSDAAAVLRCLARAFRVKDDRTLARLALEVGSDVPFFLGEGPAWARGQGERLRPAKVPVQHLVLLFPEDPTLGIRAGEAYRWLDASRQGRKVPGLPRPRPFGRSLLGNDLEPPCLEQRPVLEGFLRRLSGAGAAAVMMSGSGPTVFGVFDDRRSASKAATIISKEAGRAVRVLVARTVSRQPGVTSWRSPRSASSPSTRRS
ncbi:MAG: 4-(cytidine 5'-diphospho)-2-C-methyl-D-erythritol kinase [Anaeromyxobacteraceae bacterium]